MPRDFAHGPAHGSVACQLLPGVAMAMARGYPCMCCSPLQESFSYKLSGSAKGICSAARTSILVHLLGMVSKVKLGTARNGGTCCNNQVACIWNWVHVTSAHCISFHCMTGGWVTGMKWGVIYGPIL